MNQCVDAVMVALSLMREAMTLLDEPGAESVVHHLSLAINVAEDVIGSTKLDGISESRSTEPKS